MARLLAALVCALALSPPAVAAAYPTYMDEPGTGGTYGAFYVCTPDRCGWWFCWPGSGCYPI